MLTAFLFICLFFGAKETIELAIYERMKYCEDRKDLISYLNDKVKKNKDGGYLLGYEFNNDRTGYRILFNCLYSTGLDKII